MTVHFQQFILIGTPFLRHFYIYRPSSTNAQSALPPTSRRRTSKPLTSLKHTFVQAPPHTGKDAPARRQGYTGKDTPARIHRQGCTGRKLACTNANMWRAILVILTNMLQNTSNFEGIMTLLTFSFRELLRLTVSLCVFYCITTSMDTWVNNKHFWMMHERVWL